MLTTIAVVGRLIAFKRLVANAVTTTDAWSAMRLSILLKQTRIAAFAPFTAVSRQFSSA